MNEVTITYLAGGGYNICLHCTYDFSIRYSFINDGDLMSLETNLRILNWVRDGILPDGRKVER